MFAEEREPDSPEEETPENATPEEGAPGEPGESAPEESGAPGPEIEGAEALSAAASEEPAAEAEEPAAEEPASEEPAAEGEEPAAEEPPTEEPASQEPVAEGEEPAAEGEEPAAEGEEPAGDEAPRDRRPPRESGKDKSEEEVIPGMHLEPDLVLEEQREESEFGQYGEPEGYVDDQAGEEGTEAPAEPEPVHTPLDLAADARYRATGKRKSAVARVILKPGEGTFSINGRHLDEYFPRVKLQRVAQQPLEAAGYNTRMDVVARIHGGGVAAQATALRHGIARALVEADPALRGELKRRGYLTRDPRVKERKKAGLKKARKRPQFSKR
jgi:small subunit ribosomal protein S9